MDSVGHRRGQIIMMRGQKANDVVDANKVKDAFSKKKFTFEKHDSVNNVEDLYLKFNDIGGKEEDLHLFYIIVDVMKSKIIDAKGRLVDIRKIAEDLKKSDSRKILFLQLNIKKGESYDHLLLNSTSPKGPEDNTQESPNPPLQPLPFSTDAMLVYLPMVVGDGMSTVDILCEELEKSADMDEFLVSLTDPVWKIGGGPYPMYSSTMRGKIPLLPCATNVKGEHPPFNISENALAIFVEDFLELGMCNLNLSGDVENMNSVLGTCGRDPKRGKKSVQEIKDYVEKFAEEMERKKPPHLTIAISSHGDEDGLILGSDGVFYVRDILSRVRTLDSVMKLIIIDACRGCGFDTANSLSRTSPSDRKDLQLPINTLLVMSSSEGNQSFAQGCSSIMTEDLCTKILNPAKQGEVDVFSVLHDVMTNVANANIKISETKKAKQQVSFASTLTRPLRFFVKPSPQSTT